MQRKKLLEGFVIASLCITSIIPSVVIAEEGTPLEEIAEDTSTVELSPETATESVEDTDEGSEVTVIETGDATAISETQSVVNTSDTNTLPLADEVIPLVEESLVEGGETGTSTEPIVLIIEDGAGTEPIIEIEEETSTTTLDVLNAEDEGDPINESIENTSDGDVGNNIVVVAETGDNSTEGDGDSTSIIATGDAVAVADVLNVVNTNIYNSNGLFLFLNNLFSSFSGEYDLRNFEFFDTDPVESNNESNQSEECNGGCGGGGEVTLTNTNTAEITNNVVVRSATGGNNINGAGIINTGDAYAAANVINVANTNIVDSNYLLLTINNFGELNGDVVFPEADLFARIFGNTGTAQGAIDIENNNEADVENKVEVSADTGENTAQGEGDAGSIITGGSTAKGNVINQINTNLFGTDSFRILFRVHGDWAGDIFGAPEGLSWQQTPFGVALTYDPQSTLDEPDVMEASEANEGGGTSHELSIVNNNTANISNNISAYALTGENEINGDGWVVQTGNAYAASNVINVANTNVVGKNWLVAIVNIFGDWNGSITFGRPDLWIGGQAETAGNNAGPGSPVTYHYTVHNFGDADATDVIILQDYDHEKLDISNSNFTAFSRSHNDQIGFNIGTVPAGGSKDVLIDAYVSQNIPSGETYIDTTATVSSAEPDNNLEDNTETLSFRAYKEHIAYVYGTRVNYTPSPDLKISKSHSSPFGVRASSTVNYRITITNEGPGSAYDAVLIDTLTYEDGSVIYEEFWDLGEIYSHETIEIEYTTLFNDASDVGVYTNSAYVKALGIYHTFLYGRDADSNTAESSVFIMPAIEVYSDEEVVEIIPESVEITEEKPVIEQEITSAPPLALAALHGPLFTQHPVYINQTLSKGLLEHPVFTQHPVYQENSSLSSTQAAASGMLSNIFDLFAGSSVLRFITAPFDTLSRISVPNYIKESSGNQDEVIALLAMSIFAMRRYHYNKEDAIL